MALDDLFFISTAAEQLGMHPQLLCCRADEKQIVECHASFRDWGLNPAGYA